MASALGPLKLYLLGLGLASWAYGFLAYLPAFTAKRSDKYLFGMNTLAFDSYVAFVTNCTCYKHFGSPFMVNLLNSVLICEAHQLQRGQ